MRKVLSIAGSDSSGGAGIQADLKTITAHGLYGMTVITAVTAQNTMGVTGVHDVPSDFVEAQMDAVFTDIYPDAVKIGMVSNASNIRMIAKKLREYEVKNIIIDPVMVSTSGSKLLREDAMEALLTDLLPMAVLLTPNLPEAEILYKTFAKESADCEIMAAGISEKMQTAVLVKGGHLSEKADDYLFWEGKSMIYPGEKIDNPNTHGTGCTLSSAIACHIAMGKTIPESVSSAKEYVTRAIQAGLDLGKGSGPLNHMV